jgi:8-oxo-dGTP pyrophosphatase MutT (NUDIX family)
VLDNKKLRELFFKKEDITHSYFDELCSENNIDKSLTAAAVLVPIISNQEGYKILLTHRSKKLEDHAGQISFPGGRIDSDDKSPKGAALREANEEIGINENSIEILGHLDAYATATGFRILPIVSIIKEDFDIKINPIEVESIFYLPMEFLMNPKNHKKEMGTYKRQSTSYKIEYEYNVIPYENQHIWGATAAMLINLYETLK